MITHTHTRRESGNIKINNVIIAIGKQYVINHLKSITRKMVPKFRPYILYM
jgi:hypothetical protein